MILAKKSVQNRYLGNGKFDGAKCGRKEMGENLGYGEGFVGLTLYSRVN